MNEPQKILNTEQSALVAELTETYGIEPEEILFFEGDTKPFLFYAATCALCNQLMNLQDIDIVPVPSVSSDSFSLKCSLIFPDGRARRATGVVNLNETIDGKAMTEPQIFQLASARAIRNALKTANVDLISLHYESKGEVLNFKPKSNIASLIGQAHQLGKEALLIDGENKRPWYLLLGNRYAVNHSNELSADQLADFVAYLKTMVQPKAKAA